MYIDKLFKKCVKCIMIVWYWIKIDILNVLINIEVDEDW